MGGSEIECCEEILGVSQKITPRSGTESPQRVGGLASQRPVEGDVPAAQSFDLPFSRLLDRKVPQRSGNDETIL